MVIARNKPISIAADTVGPLLDLGHGVKARLQLVYPMQATDWLAKNNPHNRPVVRSRVRQYAADMRGNRWRLSDQAISFNADGELINGQHRLHACVLADVPFLTLVLFGLPEDSVFALDGGKKRTTDDTMTLAGRGRRGPGPR